MSSNSSNHVEDVVDSAALPPAVKKDHILERLNKRNKDRQNYLDSKNEQRRNIGLEVEGDDYFTETFNEKVHEIEMRIENVSDAAAKKTTKDGPIPDLPRIFADIRMDIQELERYLTKSTLFLTDYKVQTCQIIIRYLEEKCEDIRVRLLPKKKFGFSGKKAKVSSNTETFASYLAEKRKQTNELSTTDSIKLFKAGEDESDLNHSKNLISNYIDNGSAISNRHDEYICLKDSEVDNKDIIISSLENCFIEIQGHVGSLHLQSIHNSIILCGPVARACYAQYCENTTIAVACQQLRLHTSTSIRLYLHVTCRAIIEESKKIEVSSYNYEYETINSDFELSGLDQKVNKFDDVADFNWLSPVIPSPNWNLVNEDEKAVCDWQEMRSKFKEQISMNTSK